MGTGKNLYMFQGFCGKTCRNRRKKKPHKSNLVKKATKLRVISFRVIKAASGFPSYFCDGLHAVGKVQQPAGGGEDFGFQKVHPSLAACSSDSIPVHKNQTELVYFFARWPKQFLPSLPPGGEIFFFLVFFSASCFQLRVDYQCG